MVNIFDRLGWTPEDAAESARLAEEARIRIALELRDDRVCACGHAAKAHTSESSSEYHKTLRTIGRFECRPSRMSCPCKSFNPVLRSSNVRKFLYKTVGSAHLHALARGIEASREGVLDGSIEMEWLPDARCFACGEAGGSFMAVAIRPDGTEVPEGEASPGNVIMHSACRRSAGLV